MKLICAKGEKKFAMYYLTLYWLWALILSSSVFHARLMICAYLSCYHGITDWHISHGFQDAVCNLFSFFLFFVPMLFTQDCWTFWYLPYRRTFVIMALQVDMFWATLKMLCLTVFSWITCAWINITNSPNMGSSLRPVRIVPAYDIIHSIDFTLQYQLNIEEEGDEFASKNVRRENLILKKLLKSWLDADQFLLIVLCSA